MGGNGVKSRYSGRGLAKAGIGVFKKVKGKWCRKDHNFNALKNEMGWREKSKVGGRRVMVNEHRTP